MTGPLEDGAISPEIGFVGYVNFPNFQFLHYGGLENLVHTRPFTYGGLNVARQTIPPVFQTIPSASLAVGERVWTVFVSGNDTGEWDDTERRQK